MKAILLILNHVYLFFGATLYCGVLWSLHYFWFPTWSTLNVDNYYDQFIPQTDAATKFFTIVVPVMFLAGIVMMVTEWKTRQRWVAILASACIVAATLVGTMLSIPVNKILKTHITDQAVLTDLLQKWMQYNDIRMALLTLMWLTIMYYFISKGNLVAVLGGKSGNSAKGAAV